ncbi:D-alanyl-D-alanine carboxypeptidase [Sporosarcina sp. ANT_H38]|uniref:serine hydrolase n=1 Tax=Sporosarcina sp. ANT_H38 TaxID=2597358 RepID=UPI0011F1FDFA|nr:serine hydrolase [Sporosarcina sp. ANT_H38]KAA0948708.1 D-alanyl-D-alanine carboxypeptidase [Sporosarcina sp. ANT_H38]
MNTLAWIGMLGIVILTLLPLAKKENRTKEEMRKVIVTLAIILGIIITVLVFGVNYLLALIVGFSAMIVFDKKTYTKKRLSIYGSIILIIGIAGFAISRENPEYVLNHLKDNPKTTSLYLAENGVTLITYQSDVVRPLASTVKILIAAEYAMQIDAGQLNKDSLVPLEDLNRYYLKNSDGNAHEEWLNAMQSEGKIKNNEVTLHDIAKGMATYSSNANTDYLIDLLGISAINERAKALGLTQHEDVYPIVSAILIPNQIKSESMNEKQLIKKLEAMSMEEYRTLAEELSEQMKEGTIKAGDVTYGPSTDVQKVWSDRLVGASANDYGKLLAAISNDQFPKTASETIRDLLEWPMQLNESNHDRFVHLGAKGGSTLFILTDALYAEDHNGDKIEIVLMTDDLNFWQGMLIRNNMNSFESKLLGSEDFRLEVQKELSEM